MGSVCSLVSVAHPGWSGRADIRPHLAIFPSHQPKPLDAQTSRSPQNRS